MSIDCGETLGTYQGQVSAVDSDAQTLSISDVYRNGVQASVPIVTLK